VSLEEWVSAVDAAERLGVSRPRIHQLSKAGRLKAAHIAGRLVIHLPSVTAFAESRRGPGRPAGPMTLRQLRKRRSRLLAIANSRGARSIKVFGSVARGEAGPESDVDFLVEMNPDRSAIDVSGLWLDLEEELGRKVDLVEAGSAASPIPEISNEAVAL